MTNTNTISIIAKALSENREFKNGKINAVSVGSVATARQWIASVKALRIPAYAVRVYRYNHMGDTETVAPCDQSALYTALAPVVEMVGVVNGAKLDAHNVAEEIISNAMRFRIIDITPEMAHARNERKLARDAKNENDCAENVAEFERWDAECKRLEEIPGNCKRIAEIASESAFVKAVEILLGDAINKQALKSAEQVAAEEEAKREARKARARARKAAKKAAEAK